MASQLSFAQVVANGIKDEPKTYNYSYSVPPDNLFCPQTRNVNEDKIAGILVHPSSFPSNHGIGDLGIEARKFLDWCQMAGLTIWQILPLTPPAAGNSPYSSLSTFAGNTLLISVEDLVQEGLVDGKDLQWVKGLDELGKNGDVDFGRVEAYKGPGLEKIAHHILINCRQRSTPIFTQFWQNFQAYCKENDNMWLHDYALFVELKQVYNGDGWVRWEAPFRHRDPAALKEFSQRHEARITEIKILQFIFARQWQKLRSYAHSKGIKIMGDIPIFVSHDSADVWSHRSLFCLDKYGLPTVIAGVPPDYFSETGQLWGNPLYDWPAHDRQHYKWWLDRFQKTLEAVDLVRLDHFRGFESYWEVAADAKNAIKGRWVPAPGRELFEALTKAYGGKAPIIAEDLGIITPAVEQLRDSFNFAGMRILEFEFIDDGVQSRIGVKKPFTLEQGMETLSVSRSTSPMPTYTLDQHEATFPENRIVYTATHDNDTLVGWWQTLTNEERQGIWKFITQTRNTPTSYPHFHWQFVRHAMGTNAHTVILPLQDFFGLDTEARMNVPGKGEGNWGWRYKANFLESKRGQEIALAVRKMVVGHGRLQGPRLWMDPTLVKEEVRVVSSPAKSPAKPVKKTAVNGNLDD